MTAPASPVPVIPEPWLLSLAMLAVLALAIGGIHVIRARGERRQGVLMLLAGAVLLLNVLIWAWP